MRARTGLEPPVPPPAARVERVGRGPATPRGGRCRRARRRPLRARVRAWRSWGRPPRRAPPPAPRARAPQAARVCVLAVVCQAPPPACGRRAGWPRARELRCGVRVRGGLRAVRRGARVAAARDGAIRDVPSRARAEFGFSPGCRVFPGRRGPVGPHPPRAAVPVGRPQVSGSRGVSRTPPGWRRAACARSRSSASGRGRAVLVDRACSLAGTTPARRSPRDARRPHRFRCDPGATLRGGR